VPRQPLEIHLLPIGTLVAGIFIWRNTGSEFMPTLDEGTFMLMPTSMPHSGVEQNLRYAKQLDQRIKRIPEVESAVGKWGRAESALDPAPIQMYEVTINYKPEYMLDEDGQRARFKTDGHGRFVLKGGGVYDPSTTFRNIPRDSLVPSSNGEYIPPVAQEHPYRRRHLGRDLGSHQLPGLTGSPKLQPIASRQVMPLHGQRAPMGLKVYARPGVDRENGPTDGESLKEVKDINAASVYYDRATGAPYIEITPRPREAGALRHTDGHRAECHRDRHRRHGRGQHRGWAASATPSACAMPRAAQRPRRAARHTRACRRRTQKPWGSWPRSAL
jgi:Cu(I)/Ag(I) efflux system membrane protein CusA/SilA